MKDVEVGAKKDKTRLNNKSDYKSKYMTVIAVCAIAFVLLYALSNLEELTERISSFLSVMSPIIIGFAIAYMLDPILRLFEYKVFKKLKKKNLIRILSIICTFISAILLLAAFMWLLIPQVITSVKGLVDNYDGYINSTINLINGIINDITESGNYAEYINAAEAKQFIVNFFSKSGNIVETITEYVTEYGAKLFVGVKNVVIGMFIAAYVLISKEKLLAQARKFGTAVMSPRKNRLIGKYLSLASNTFSNYFVGMVVDSMLVLLEVLLLLLIFNVPYALLVAVIVGVTNIIPIFGPIIGSIPSFFIIFIVDPTKALIFLIIILVVQQIDGNIIAPKILGNSTGISSLGVLCAIVVMGSYFGVLGMIVGVPLFALIVAVVKEIIDRRLKSKGKSTDTEDYYHKDAMIEPGTKHRHVVAVLINVALNLFMLILSLFSKNIREKRKLKKAEALKAKESAKAESKSNAESESNAESKSNAESESNAEGESGAESDKE